MNRAEFDRAASWPVAAGIWLGATYLVGGAATGAAQGASQAGTGAQSTGAPSEYFVDMLFRPDPGSQSAASAQAGADPAVRREIGRIFLRSLREGGDLPAADRTYVAQMVAARPASIRPRRIQRVSDVINQAKAAADEARKAAAKLALWLTAAMLIGAFAASLAAIEGGQLRDGTWKGVIGGRNYRPQRTN